MTSAGTTGRRSTASLAGRRTNVENFGWPCYEGIDRQPGYDAANLNICESLYAREQSRRRSSISP